MKKTLLLLFCMLFKTFCHSQNIDKVEYFFDTDPGYNNGVNVPITADTVITNFPFNADLTLLGYGLHTLSIRSRDINGKWSLTNNQTIYKFTPYTSTSNTTSFPLINKIEYFVDTDPGYGNGVNVPVTSDSIFTSFTFNADITSLSYGLHTLYIRSRDANGKWSLTNHQTIYKFTPYSSTSNSGTLPSVNKMEYFIDTDPGYGNGVNVPVTSDSLISNYAFNADITSLAYGLHTLYIRSRDENGKWSLTNNQTIYKFTPYTSTSITGPLPSVNKIEYFIDTDPGYGNGVDVPLISFDSIMTNFAFNVNTTGLPQGNHTLYIRTRDANGKWSLTNIKTFSSCPVPAAIADFTYVQDNQNFMFTNNSQNMVSCVWDFGDGTTSTVFDPFHTFNLAGTRNVCMIAANVNTCTPYKDTLCQTVHIDGISSISPNSGSNSGQVTVDILGSGFIPGTIFKIKKTGQPDIYGGSLNVLSSTHLRGTLNLSGAVIGIWDLQVITPNITYNFTNGFAITSTPACSGISVSITGSWVLRLGFQQIYTITIQNLCGNDIRGVPVFISGLPAHSNITYINSVVEPNTIPEIQTLNIQWDSIPDVFYDSNSNTSFTGLIVPTINANGNQTIEFIVTPPPNTPLHSYNDIVVTVDQPILPSIDDPAYSDLTNLTVNPNPYLNDCLDGTNGIVKSAAESVLDLFSFNSWLNCGNGILNGLDYGMDKLVSLFVKKGTGTNTPGTSVIKLNSAIRSHLKVIKSCADAAASVLIPEVKMFQMTSKIIKNWGRINNVVNLVNTNLTCLLAMQQAAYSHQNVIIGNAWDPNVKYGLGAGSDAHYTNETGSYAYTIGFENDTAANLPAQRVQVIDTIDKSKFDVSTFGFTSITVGDSSISFTNKPKAFIRDVDLTSRMGVKVRITGSIDTVSGIVNWVFNSINPATNQITTNALAGFLPPDTNSPLGQGYVSFLVNTKAGNQDTVHNRATIIFDYNAPIITNDWQSIIDTTKPNSTVDNLPSISTIDSFIVSWHGTDSLSGIRDYSVYVAKNGGSYEPWLMNTSDTSSYFKGVKGNTYYFYTRATDSAGNVENIPGQYDASVFIVDCDSALQASLDTVGNVQICAGDSVILKASGGNSYLWSNGKTSDSIAIYTSGYYSVLVSNSIGCTKHMDTTLVAVIPCNMGLNVKLFIEGYYIGSGMMSSALYNEGVSSNTSITDSIDIELRNQYAPYQVQYATKMILDHMGYASSNIQVDSNYYYLAIKHRNGIQTWSAEPVFVPSSSIYDFTVTSSKAYGNNMKEIANHVWGLFSGDFNLDENIDLLDLAILESYIPYFQYGYFETDINGDGNVDLLDVPMVEQNINDFIFSNHP